MDITDSVLDSNLNTLNNLLSSINDLIISPTSTIAQTNRNLIIPTKLNIIDSLYNSYKNDIYLIRLLRGMATNQFRKNIINSVLSTFINSVNNFKNKILKLLSISIDCKNAVYGPLIQVVENNIQKLVRRATDSSDCEAVILEQADVPTVEFNETTNNITTTILMRTTELAKLSDPNNNFTPEEIDIIKNFIINTSGLSNSVISDMKFIDNNNNVVFTTSYNPTFTNTFKTNYTGNKNTLVVNLISHDSSNIKTTFSDNFNINYIKNLIANSSHVYK